MNNKEMLNRIIDNLLEYAPTRTVIQYLVYLGFSEDDIESLNFERDDISEVREEMMRNGYDGESVCPTFEL